MQPVTTCRQAGPGRPPQTQVNASVAGPCAASLSFRYCRKLRTFKTTLPSPEGNRTDAQSPTGTGASRIRTRRVLRRTSRRPRKTDHHLPEAGMAQVPRNAPHQG